MQAVPEYLRVSLFNDFSNDGLGAVKYLRGHYDATDANDHASHIARLQAHYIDPKSDISETDLRAQYDAMMIAKGGILRTGGTAPPDSVLISMFDNSLPQAYSQIRQLVRREAHDTFLAHYSDYMTQVRAEVASRTPLARAFAARGITDGSRGGGGTGGGGRGGGVGGGGGGDDAGNPCLRCGLLGHGRNKCNRPKVKCRTCGADHLTEFCTDGPGGPSRDKLSRGALDVVRRDVSRQKSRSPGGPKPGQGHALSAGAPAPAPAPAPASAAAPAALAAPPGSSSGPIPDAAHAAASAAAASAGGDPLAVATAYTSALRGLGYTLCASTSTQSAGSPSPTLPEGVSAPARSKLLHAMVDSMATY